jgi:hypothetical protein
MSEVYVRANVGLVGISEGLSNDLQEALGRVSGAFAAEPVESVETKGADVVFCAPDTGLVRELRRQFPSAVIIAAGKYPNTDDWLDMIEAGADDYCAAPFETAQLRWMLQSNLFNEGLAA